MFPSKSCCQPTPRNLHQYVAIKEWRKYPAYIKQVRKVYILQILHLHNLIPKAYPFQVKSRSIPEGSEQTNYHARKPEFRYVICTCMWYLYLLLCVVRRGRIRRRSPSPQSPWKGWREERRRWRILGTPWSPAHTAPEAMGSSCTEIGHAFGTVTDCYNVVSSRSPIANLSRSLF